MLPKKGPLGNSRLKERTTSNRSLGLEHLWQRRVRARNRAAQHIGLNDCQDESEVFLRYMRLYQIGNPGP